MINEKRYMRAVGDFLEHDDSGYNRDYSYTLLGDQGL